jgi:hypothetical protein
MRSCEPLSVVPSMLASLSLSTVLFAACKSLPLKSALFLLFISPRWLPLRVLHFVLAGLFELVHPSSSASLMLLPTLFKQPIFAVCVVLRDHFMLACIVFAALVTAMRTLRLFAEAGLRGSPAKRFITE